jgi:hypothetical protein
VNLFFTGLAADSLQYVLLQGPIQPRASCGREAHVQGLSLPAAAVYTQTNNVMGTINVLYAIKVRSLSKLYHDQL